MAAVASRWRALAVAAVVTLGMPRLASAQDELPDSIEELDLEALLAAPVVQTASKREQSIEEAPVSVSVVDAETISTTNAFLISDLLRRVPGVHVVQIATNQVFVGMRGLNPLNSNRTLTLIDGRDTADLSWGRGTWELMAAHPGDVEKIEVIRGPGSTLYGANAFSGIIDIRTKQPLDHPGVEAEANVGTSGVPRDGEVFLGGIGSGYLAVGVNNDASTFGVRNSFGFTNMPSYTELGADIEPGRASPFGYHDRLAVQWRPDDDTDLRVTVSHALTSADTFTSTESEPVPSKESEQAATIQLEQKKVGTDDLAMTAAVNGRKMTMASVQEAPEQHMVHGSLQFDASLFDGRNVTTLGADSTYRRTQHFFATDAESLRYGLMLQTDTKLTPDGAVMTSLGLRAEQFETGADSEPKGTYRNLTPRGAVIWRFAENHTLRLSGSTAVRTPTIFETSVGASFRFWGPDEPVNELVMPNPALEQERVTAVEVGYRGVIAETLRLDGVVFAQRIDGLVDTAHSDDLPRIISNELDLQQIGVEVDAKFAVRSTTSAYTTLTYTHTEDRDTGETLTSFPPLLAAAGVEQRFSSRTRLIVDLSYASVWRPTFFELGEGGSSLVTAEQPWHIGLDVRVSREVVDGGEVYLGGKNLGAFFRPEDETRQFPAAVAEPIGGAVFVGLRLSKL